MVDAIDNSKPQNAQRKIQRLSETKRKLDPNKVMTYGRALHAGLWILIGSHSGGRAVTDQGIAHLVLYHLGSGPYKWEETR